MNWALRLSSIKEELVLGRFTLSNDLVSWFWMIMLLLTLLLNLLFCWSESVLTLTALGSMEVDEGAMFSREFTKGVTDLGFTSLDL